LILFSLANKHGIFDHQSVVPSGSTSTIPSLLTSSTDIIDTNTEHPFTVISTLINNNHDDLSSPSSDNHHDENETELGSLQHQMNGVITGNDNDINNHNYIEEENDEQDGSTSNPLINLPQQIATILGNDNIIKTDDDQRVMTTNSPTNNLDFQSSTNSLRQSSTKLLEDFCDICQKHFCNKYYLRVSFFLFYLTL
jgi:hypothetical protein